MLMKLKTENQYLLGSVFEQHFSGVCPRARLKGGGDAAWGPLRAVILATWLWSAAL